MEDFEESMSDCSVDSNELPPMPPLIRIRRNISGDSYAYGTLSAQTSSDSPITGIDQLMQNAAAEVLPDLDPEDTLSLHKEDMPGAPPAPLLTRSTKKECSSASSLDHDACCVSSLSKRGQVWHDEKKHARPGKSFELGHGDNSPSKYSGNVDPEQPVQLELKSTVNTSFSSYPFEHSRLSETWKQETTEEGDSIDLQGVRGHDIRHQSVGSQCTATVLDQGKSSMSKTLHKCQKCPKQFKTACDLRRHDRVHTGERPFKCDVCSKYFSQSSYVKVHKRVHTGKRPYKCDTCEASFKQSSHLRDHERIHTGERHHKCDTCEASFKQSSHLRDHERIHTGERHHKCKVCGASFRQLSTLHAHERGTH
ncbi:zinc finger protein 626-like [Sycon ciliatum]|uniref:zinc finger protein 626-like n=1 Tax=Sycon ciliatum TaxID=27933 RepID=UPI0031F635B2